MNMCMGAVINQIHQITNYSHCSVGQHLYYFLGRYYGTGFFFYSTSPWIVVS